MQFTVRDLIWATALIALVMARFLDLAATRKEEREIEQLAHRIDTDLHNHLGKLDDRLRAVEGWANSVDRREEVDARRNLAVDQALGDQLTEILKLKELLPAPTKRSP